MTEVIAESAPTATPAILSGPSFASDVARGLPTAVTLACADEEIAAALAHALGSPTFRPYHTADVRGVEIGGAAKNVLAIAAGIVQGRKLGASATAALVTRGFAELARFGRACGARTETLTGLSGLGDVVLSCASAQSRNFAYGIALGEGRKPRRQARRRRVHRVGAGRDGDGEAGRDADRGRDRGGARRQAERRCGDRVAADTAVPGGVNRNPTTGAFPSPLWGGVRGGGREMCAGIVPPPPRPPRYASAVDPPHKGEGKKERVFAVSYCCRSPRSSTSCFCSPICFMAKA